MVVARRSSVQRRNNRTRCWVISLLTLALIVAVGLGVGLGVGLTRNKNSSTQSISSANDASGGSSSSSSGTRTSSSGSSSSSSASSSAASASATPAHVDGQLNITVPDLARWDWLSPTNKMLGVALGNWLVMERWMNEQAFVNTFGANAWDEWDASQVSNASAIFLEHWNTWVTEDDIETLSQNGINTVRIPVGFWALIPTVAGEPYLSMAGQLDQINRILGYLYARKMYAIIDLHGMPGAQTTDQYSGHNNTNPTFWHPDEQIRGDQTVAAAQAFIINNPYRSIISALAVCNEPRPYSQANFEILKGFYERSYATLSTGSYPIPMQFHHGFVDTENHLVYWQPFVNGKDPSLLMLEDHPYPGNFPLQNDTTDIIAQVCNDAKGYVGYPVPVAVTEWSLTSGVTTSSFETQFYEAQASAWAWSGGSVFWSLRTVSPQLDGTDISQYSFLTMLANGAIPAVNGQSTQAYIASFNAPCGADPNEAWSLAGNQNATAAAIAAADPGLTTDAPVVSASAAAKKRRSFS
ncbi:glycoside hydrolase family 5 protein [Mixia osmundae IAM 14324]|uniref:glucan 1,3-beta-glucosidase n=1 Tax=Mixia osmundae (strain CBS 9802 / IAM 14324 / JCM 22182 / KY 12970) TaxID=764103 RepID=G7E7Y3_MIXOS|nr:glycoside hydrolase family 5 protein [Mixia osmundae IAM 14324]KEI38543.1 glycoside hydrolase family 5 protein [Mixia osmundae IAM 14324]GAA98943.1 hypothetical protein E5Q_05631 [Mixia osmundae IAM 14324]